MESLDTAFDLLQDKKFSEAKSIIQHHMKDDANSSVAHYYLGLWYEDFYNPEKNKDQAKRNFIKAMEGSRPIDLAYTMYTRVEDNRNQCIRVLKRGLEVFPSSVPIYERLIAYTPNKDLGEIFSGIDQKGITSDAIEHARAAWYFEDGKYEQAYELLKNLAQSDTENGPLLKLVGCFCAYELGQFEEASKGFDELVHSDLKNRLQYVQYFGQVLCLLKFGKNDSAIQLFSEIPFEYDHEYFIPGFYSSFVFQYRKYVDVCLDEIAKITQDKRVLAILKAIRTLSDISRKSGQNEKITSKEMKELEFSAKHLPRNTKIWTTLYAIHSEKKNHLQAINCLISFFKHNAPDVVEESLYIPENHFSEYSQSDISSVTKTIKESLESGGYYEQENIRTYVIPDLVERLFALKLYKEITELLSGISDEKLFDLNIAFELAYAFNEIKEHGKARRIYTFLFQKEKTSPVANNLALICEKQGEYSVAKELFEKAIELDNKNERARNNLNRVNELILEQQKALRENKLAAEAFLNENIWLQQKVLKFSTFANSQGMIVCPYKQLPQMLGVAAMKSTELINSLLEKSYVSKVIDHGINTTSSVYRINPEIQLKLNEIEENVKKESDLIAIAEDLNTKTLDRIGYNPILISYLGKISSQDLQQSLERDIRENALSLINRSYKSALIMSGSIIEAFLLDKIQAKGITSHLTENGKTKDVEKMDLNELLFVSKSCKIINDDVYYLSHALRGYRNIIHPGVEIRKKAIQVNETNARLAWDITRKIIQES